MGNKVRKFEQWQDMIARLYPELREGKDEKGRVLSRTVTFQVTNACNLCCKYCYQINKGKDRMSFDTAKEFIDLLLSGEKGFKEYVNPDISPSIISSADSKFNLLICKSAPFTVSIPISV